ncbi:hypothetical protein HQ520_13350 [bacterium]|nr:hypothetical protein [bacterium]
MAHAGKRKVAALCGDGHIRLIEQEIPAIRPGAVLVGVRASLVSPGTELGGWPQLKAKREDPDPKAKPLPFGYANAGEVIGVGEGVTEYQIGDRVACMGGGYALHTDYSLVPHHLCAPLPDNLTFEQGSYGHLAATALQGLRRGEPEFGGYAAIVGLGIVGQLAGRLHQLAGNFVIGWDTIRFRTDLAALWCVDRAVLVGHEDEVAATQEFTNGHGLDTATMAFGGDGSRAYQSLKASMKLSLDGHRMGNIVMIGSATFPWDNDTTNLDIRRSSRSGPGYHDEPWEFGAAYPPVFMRWTTQTNLKLCLRLMAEGKLPVEKLTTHRIPLQRVEEETTKILEDPDKILGVVFTMED